jgi:hypothetical protein
MSYDIKPHAFLMVTPKDLLALESGVMPPHLDYPQAIQACSEEAEAAHLRGVKTAGTCRLVFVSSNDFAQ